MKKNQQKSYYRRYDDLTDYEEVINLQLREMDIEEVRASSGGLEPREVLKLSLIASDQVWVVIHNGKIEAVFGVTKTPTSEGIPWFLTTDKFKEFTIAFAKESKKVVQEMLKEYKRLYNVVSANHKEAIEWLEWLGFTVEKNPITYNDYNFYYFFMDGSEKEECVIL